MKRRLSDLVSLKRTIHQEEITEEMLEIMGGDAAVRKKVDQVMFCCFPIMIKVNYDTL